MTYQEINIDEKKQRNARKETHTNNTRTARGLSRRILYVD